MTKATNSLKFRDFVRSQAFKELFSSVMLILVVSLAVGVTSNLSIGILFLITTLFIDTLFFHVLWIYRDMDDNTRNPVIKSLKLEFQNLIIGSAYAGVIFILLIISTIYFNINIYVSSSIVAISSMLLLFILGFREIKNIEN